MLPWFTENFGNAASRGHSFGWVAEQAVEQARKRIAELIHAAPREVVFTSGATESNNLALKGVAEPRAGHVVTVATEHKAVLDTCHALQKRGCEVTYLPVERDGLLDLNRLEAALTERTVLVSVMWANNEIGVLQPIREIGALCRARGILFHSDAAQAAGKVPIDAAADQVDLLSLSAHKMYGPKGIGALYIRRGVQVAAQIHGGGHERGYRSGTLNVPAIVGFGEAAAIAQREMPAEFLRLAALRDRLKAALEAELDQIAVNGSLTHRLPDNLNVSFAHVDAEAVLMGLPDIALSTGSACTSATPAPSYVLKALGLQGGPAHGALRLGLGRTTTQEEVDYAAARIVEVVKKLRELNPIYEPASQLL